MPVITCNCKKTSMNFKNLKPSDFPEGWENDCCRVSNPPKIQDKPEVKTVKNLDVTENIELPVEPKSQEELPQTSVGSRKKRSKKKS